MEILHPNKDNFNELLKESGILVVDFFATWCGPCKMLSPIIEELAAKNNEGVKIAKIDIDENEELATTFDVQAVPTIIFFKDGNEVERKVGVVSLEELENIIKSHK